MHRDAQTVPTSWRGDSDGDSSDTEIAESSNTQRATKALLGGEPTMGDVRELCSQLIQAQLRAASDQNASMNTDIRGDRAVRRIVGLLLPDTMQRQLFLKTTETPSNWPRLRSLFGAPPYQFLHAEDASLLRAAGFARGRTNMAYGEGAARTANYAQFGTGQMVDSFDREYRIGRDDVNSFPSADNLKRMAGDVHLQVKVRKLSIQKKIAILRRGDLAAQRRQLEFPHPGERLRLSDSPFLMRVRGMERASSAEVVVRAVSLRGKNASTAALLVRPLG